MGFIKRVRGTIKKEVNYVEMGDLSKNNRINKTLNEYKNVHSYQDSGSS